MKKDIFLGTCREIIEFSNGDGTKRVELFGFKIIENGNEMESNVKIVIPNVIEDNSTILTDCASTDEDSILYTIHIPN